jgi:hypothetical protein
MNAIDRRLTVCVLPPGECLPPIPDPNVLYLATYENGDYSYAEFDCPCGGSRCWEHINLDPVRAKRCNICCWTLTINKQNQPTLTPSVNHLSGCKVHYWLQDGRFQLC